MQFVEIDKGGVIHHTLVDVPHDGARWDASPAPTCTLYAKDGGEILASQAATLGPSTTLSASAAAGGTSLSVTSATSFRVGERIWVGPNSSGQWEDQICVAVAAGSVTTATELAYSYGSGVTVKSHRMTVTVTSSDASAIRPFARADWEFAVDGVSRREEDQFHIARHVPRHSVTVSSIRDFAPILSPSIGSDQDLRRLIAATWERFVLPAIFKSWEPGAVVDASAMDQALIYRVMVIMSEGVRDREGRDQYMVDYNEAIDRGWQMTTVDVDQDDAVGATERPAGRGVVRWRRG